MPRIGTAKKESLFVDEWAREGDHWFRHARIGSKVYRVTLLKSEGLNTDTIGKNLVEKAEKPLRNYIRQAAAGGSADLVVPLSEKKGPPRSLSSWIHRESKERKATRKLVETLSRDYFRIHQERAKFQEIPPKLRLGVRRVAPRISDVLSRHIEDLSSRARQELKNNEPEILADGVKRWDFEIDGKKCQWNDYPEGYDKIVSTEAFFKREELVYQAALRACQSEEPKQKIKEFHERCMMMLHAQCSLDQSKLQSPEGDRYYEEVNRRAVNILSTFARQAQALLDQHLGEGFTLSDLERMEQEVVLERGRPIVINSYNVSGQEVLSIQEPARERTIPSTVRNIPGLGNHVITSFASVNEKGGIHALFSGVRHTSYTPIRKRDPYLRQAVGLENVKEGLSALAAQALAEDPSLGTREEPLAIPLRTMMLFTPKIGDFARNRSKAAYGKWRGESEVQQMHESLMALGLLKDRVFLLKVGDEEVWVKLDSSVMNLGVNQAAAGKGAFGAMPDSSRLAGVNAAGFTQFLEEIDRKMLREPLSQEARDLMGEIERLETGERRYLKAVKRMEEVEERDRKSRLELQEQLEALYGQYAETGDRTAAWEIDHLHADWTRLEKRRLQASEKLLEEKRRSYMNRQERIGKLEKKLEEVLASDLRDLAICRRRAKELFYTGDYKRVELLNELPALYIQVQSRLGNIPEFFCKSGEDRTGRVNTCVEEAELFAHHHGTVVANDQDRQTRDQFSQQVAACSASMNNTEENSNARGLQIDSSVNPHLPAGRTKKQATMAKRVYH